MREWSECWLTIKCLHFNYLHVYIALLMTSVPDLINEAGLWHQSGDKWCQTSGHNRVHTVIWHWRKPLESPWGGPTFILGATSEVIINYKGSSSTEIEPCQYCDCTLFASNFPISSWGNGTTNAQTTKLHPPQQIVEVWPCFSHPDTATTEVHCKPACPQSKASGDQNVPHHENTTIEITKQIREGIILTKTSGPILSDDTYSMVEKAWKLPRNTQDY